MLFWLIGSDFFEGGEEHDLANIIFRKCMSRVNRCWETIYIDCVFENVYIVK